MTLFDLFPEAVLSEDKELSGDWLTLEGEGQIFQLPLASLTEREKALLQLKNTSPRAESAGSNVWYQYLIQKRGHQPQSYEKVQLLYIDHQDPLPRDLINLLANLLSNVAAEVEVTPTRTVLLLNQAPELTAEALIRDVLPTLENDFGVTLTIFLGNSWAKLQEGDLQTCFDEENRLFSDFIRHKGSKQTVTFAQLILWGFSRQLDLPFIKRKIRQFIEDSKDMSDVIVAMWQEHGNLVKSAQSLYLHRNSLQYKLEKFRTLSGLNLKKLDDLAFAYLLMLKDNQG